MIKQKPIDRTQTTLDLQTVINTLKRGYPYVPGQAIYPPWMTKYLASKLIPPDQMNVEQLNYYLAMEF